MNLDQARQILRNHARYDQSDDGLLRWLSPYRGVNDVHLVEIIEAVHTLGPVVCVGSVADREIVADLWNLCFTVRCWTRGPHEPMFHGRNFISTADKARLDDWLFTLERWINLVLNTGQPRRIDWHLFKRIGIADRAGFALPFVLRELQKEMDTDPHFEHDEKMSNCEVLAAMGVAAAPAAELLERLGQVTNSSEIRAAAHAALAAIRTEQR